MRLVVLVASIPLASALISSNALLPRQAGSGVCMTECATQINVTTSCVTSTDAFCGCAQWLLSATTCNNCLMQNNATLLGFLDTTYVQFLTAVCQCQIPSCQDLILKEKQCTLMNANDTTCACPATLKDAPACYHCVKQNDPSVGPSLDARVAFCQAANISSTSSPSGSAAASQSALPTFASGSSILGVPISAWIVGGGVAFLLAAF